jgi:succinate dehydrogenase/fumarate reductase flavoprotein subunit
LKETEIQRLKLAVKSTMWKETGIVRSADTLSDALQKIEDVMKKLDFIPLTEEEIELKNLATVAKLITKAALDREESRGAHYRSDFPKTDDKNWKKHLVYRSGG